jgi:hypothetical protein
MSVSLSQLHCHENGCAQCCCCSTSIVAHMDIKPSSLSLAEAYLATPVGHERRVLDQMPEGNDNPQRIHQLFGQKGAVALLELPILFGLVLFVGMRGNVEVLH